MKIVVISMALLFSAMNTKASNINDAPRVAMVTSNSIASEIGAQLSYHQLAESFAYGIAFVEIEVVSGGKIKVVQANAANAEQRALITKEIEALNLYFSDTEIGNKIALRIRFDLKQK
jgi:predicted nucleic acid-binding protein